MSEVQRAACSACPRTDVPVRVDGLLRKHPRPDTSNIYGRYWCDGSGKAPKESARNARGAEPAVRVTPQTCAVLAVLASEPSQERYGNEISTATRIRSGTIYPILARLAAAGWVSGQWEDIDPPSAGRPPRRYWRLAPAHIEQVRALLDARRVVLVPVSPDSLR